MNNSGKVKILFPIFVVAFIILYFMFGWDIQVKLHPNQTVHNITELSHMVNDQIERGLSSGTFYVEGATTEDITNLNERICSVSGQVTHYSILERSRKGMKIYLKYEISDNYYVFRKYRYNEPIPNDHPLANKLYDKVVEIIDKEIDDDMSDYEKELAIHDYIVSHCAYGYPELSEKYAYRAYGCLCLNTAVCNGYAEAMALLLNCVGVENEIMTGYGNEDLHAWNRVRIDGFWYQVDATWDDPVPDRTGKTTHMYFNVTDDIMDDMHTWDKEEYSACNSLNANYFVQNNLICNYDGFQSAVRAAANKDITGNVEALLLDYDEDLYNLSFVYTIDGVNAAMATEPVQYGEYTYLSIYLNQRE